jgi:CheY-like chemotaxis protein
MLTAPHILIADDEPQLGELLRRSVAAYLPAARTTVVADGYAALQVCLGQPVDLLLTDEVMPRLSGIDLARLLRTRGRRLPIILVSGSGVARAAVYEAGINAFIAKPWDLADIQSMLQRAGVLNH